MPKAQQFRDVSRVRDSDLNDASHLRGANITSAGVHNRKVILNAIRTGGSVLRHDLAAMTGLTTPAVFKIARDLMDDGLILSERTREKVRGQPASTMKLNPDAAFSLGLNVDRNHLTLVCVDFAGQVRQRFHFPMAFAEPSDVRAFVGNCLDRIRAQDAIPMARITGIGIAAPDGLGWGDLPGQPERYSDWIGVRLPDLLHGVTDLPVVHDNDAAAAAIGEMLFGSGLELGSFFYVFLGASLSGGLVINRRFVRGAHRRSGELSGLPRINPLRRSQTDLRQTLGDAVLTSDLLDSLHARGYREASMATLGQLDPGARPVIDEWLGRVADYLYLPLLTILGSVDPDAILIGGQLPAALTEALCQEVSKRLSMHVGVHWPDMAVRPARVAADPAAVGAAVLAFQDVWEGS